MMNIPQRIGQMKEIASDLWFTWQRETEKLCAMLDRQLWTETNHNPTKFMRRLYPQRWEKAALNPEFLNLYHRLLEKYAQYQKEKTWYQQNYPESNLLIAYFSAELGLHESLPVYGGGLGILAGDHLKSCGDLGIPLVGVSILYKNSYFKQKINRDGWQEAAYPMLKPEEIPVTPCLGLDGTYLIIPVEIGEKTVYTKIWLQKIGRIKLYLLDTDIPSNNPEERKITGQLYGGDEKTRIAQEIVLGIGGVKALRALGLKPSVWHINEGHAAFLVIERLRELTNQSLSWSRVVQEIKSRTVFTTHTPVPAGHDIFPPELVLDYLSQIIRQLPLTPEEFLALGRGEGHGFNMTKLAFSHSAYVNGVSRLHARVSKKIFSPMYPHLTEEKIPISSVTNGVHLATWTAPEINDLFCKYLGEDWIKRQTDPRLWKKIHLIPDRELWETHQVLKKKMISFVRANVYRYLKRNLEPAFLIREILKKLKPEVFTIGFARRFATYKRADLILKDWERLDKLLNHPERPVNIIFAGKAHPADRPGQEIIKRISDLAKEERFRGRVVFVEDYDIHVARYLLSGTDLWLNTPRRPLEASGTSGQKAAVNGVLNCSIPDGWWPEATNGKNGFTIGKEEEFPNESIHDEKNHQSLFHLLEEKIVPCYYHQTNGLPKKWISHMKESLATIPWYFNSERMVQEYFEKFYLPAGNRAHINKDGSF
jgi:starch phosphorylase